VPFWKACTQIEAWFNKCSCHHRRNRCTAYSAARPRRYSISWFSKCSHRLYLDRSSTKQRAIDSKELGEFKRCASLGGIDFRMHSYIAQEMDDALKVAWQKTQWMWQSNQPLSRPTESLAIARGILNSLIPFLNILHSTISFLDLEKSRKLRRSY
jgi:hypothetical protein